MNRNWHLRALAFVQATLLLTTLLLPALVGAASLPPSLSASLTGDAVTVTGADWAAGDAVSLVTTDPSGGQVDSGSATADTSGALTYQVTLAAPVSGTYTISGSATSGGSASATFEGPAAPMDTSAPTPTDVPVVTSAPTDAPVVTPAPTDAPVVTPAPTDAPVVTPGPTEVPPTFVPSGPPTIASDQADYPPGGHVFLTGTNWQADEPVHLFVNDNVGNSWSWTWDTIADGSGSLTQDFYLPNWFVATYSVTASGTLSGIASSSFTDGNVSAAAIDIRETTCTTTQAAFSPGSTVCAHVVATIQGGGSTSWRIQWYAPAAGGAAAIISTATPARDQLFTELAGTTTSTKDDNFAVSTAGTWTVVVCKTGNAGSCSSGNQVQPTTFTVNASAATSTGIVSSSNPSTYGSSISFTATVTSSPVNPSNVGTVTFRDGGTVICTAVALSVNTATCLISSLSAIASPHSITADYSGATGFAASTSGALSQVITPKNLTISGALANNKVYDGNDTATVNFAGATLVGIVGSDVVTIVTTGYGATFATTSVANGIAVTVTGVTLGGAQAGNYTVSQPTGLTANISKADAVCTVTPYAVTYNGSAHTATGQCTGVGGVLDVLVGLSLSNTTHTMAGTYTTDSWTFTDVTGNYSNQGPTTISDSIGKADATTTVVCPAGPYTYSGAAQTPCSASWASTGLDGEGANLSVSYTNNINAGTAQADATFGGDANHTGSSGSTTFVLRRAPRAAPAHTPPRLYGDANPSLTYVVTGFKNGETAAVVGGAASCSTTAILTSTVAGSTYPITCTIGTLSAANYDFPTGNFVAGALTVNRAHLMVTADPKTKVLNAANPPLTYVVAGFKNGETAAVVGGAASCSTTAVMSSPVGSYPITCTIGTLSAANYDFPAANFVAGALAVQYASASGTCLGSQGHVILQPINSDWSSVFKSGSTVPAKFRVCDATGASIGTPGVVSSFILAQTFSGTISTTVDEAVISTTPDSAFRWDPTDQQWIFNINTKGMKTNLTYAYEIHLNDGSTIYFRFGLK